MADLYLAIRSDRRGIVKIGRSDNPYRRCDSLAASHCFRVQPAVVYPGAGSCESAVHSLLDSRRVEGGPGREWFTVTLQQAVNAVHRCLSHDFGGNRADGLGSNAWRAANFVERLMPVAGPEYATEQAEIDALTEKLYGNQWQGVLQAAGLVRHKCNVDGVNRYVYQLQFPDCAQSSYVTLRDASIDLSDDPVDSRVTDRLDMPGMMLFERITPVAGPRDATEQAEIDTLAEQLYGNRWQEAVTAVGLIRHRVKVSHVHKYFYQMQFPDCPQVSYVAIKTGISAVLQCGQHAGRRVGEFLERLTTVAGPKVATEQAEIDTLAEQLYGNRWQGAVHAAGLVRYRTKVGGVNRYFYRLQLPGSPHMSYVAIK